MKAVLGVAALLLGVVLVLGGLYGFAASVALSGSEPEFAEGIGGWALLALLLGSLLSCAGWCWGRASLFKPTGNSPDGRRCPPVV
ncbi:MAG: hypothetical protein FJ020_09655 [Chloroflexi bacterium]|nr:hypothetical protein [Chloroflexota bacterium]